MDWNQFSAIGKREITKFRKELFSDIFYGIWRDYKESGDEKIMVAVFLQVIHEFPELKDMFDDYYDQQYTDKDLVWSNKKIILRFFQKLLIILDNIEIENEKA